MIKNVYIIIIFFCVHLTISAQVDNTIYIAAMTEIQEPEDKLLDEVEEKQMQLTYATTAMSYASVLMANTETKLHKGLVLVYDVIDNAEVILQIIKTSKDIMTIQDQILETSQDNPDLMLVAAYYEVDWLRKASAVVTQLIIATKESKFSIMSNYQRLELLHMTADSLKEIKSKTLAVQKMLNSYKAVLDIELAEVILEYDFQTAIDNINLEINDLLKI